MNKSYNYFSKNFLLYTQQAFFKNICLILGIVYFESVMAKSGVKPLKIKTFTFVHVSTLFMGILNFSSLHPRMKM